MQDGLALGRFVAFDTTISSLPFTLQSERLLVEYGLHRTARFDPVALRDRYYIAFAAAPICGHDCGRMRSP